MSAEVKREEEGAGEDGDEEAGAAPSHAVAPASPQLPPLTD